MIEGINSLTQENVDDFTTNNNGIVICHKTLCPHCKVMGKVLHKVVEQDASIALASIDTETESALMEKFGVERVPTLLVFKDGELKAKKVAIMKPKEVLAFYKEV